MMRIAMNGDSPIVSVIIPTCRRAEIVNRAVESALQQTFTQLEVIVVIDGPDPATNETLSSVLDPRLKVISLPESVGGSEARNVGARKAKGRFVAFLDDDDEWMPHKVQRQITKASTAGEDSVVVVSKYLLRQDGSDIRVLPRRLPTAKEPWSEYLMCGSRIAAPENGFQTSTLFISKAILEGTPFTKDLPRHQDWDWFLRTMLNSTITLLIIPEALSIVHVDTARESVSKGLNWQDSLQWAKANRYLFTNKAYSSFVARQCALHAGRSQSKMKSAILLLRECVLAGSPTLITVLILIRHYLAPLAFFRSIKRFMNTRAASSGDLS